MATTANYAAIPRLGTAQISTANTARDGTGTIGTVFTAGANGSRIEEVQVVAPGTTTAGMVRLFVHDGTNTRFLCDIPVSAVTPGGTTMAFATSLRFANLLLPSGHSLRASTHNAETFNVFAFGGDF